MPLWATARTIIIRPDGSGDYKTIQGALDEAKKGYVIKLAPGTYRGAGNVNLDFLGVEITLVGDPAHPRSRVIDCRGGDGTWRAINLQYGEGRGTVIEGITFRGDPTVSENPLEHSGGLVLCRGASPSIRDCVFEGGRAYRGGAISLERSNAEISRCQFRDNSAEVGGAVMASAGAMVLQECHFESNFAARGGAIYVLLSNMVVTACTVANNTAGVGGGIACDERSTLLLDRLVVTDNYASYGGGVSVADSKLDMHQCTLAQNSGGGGGNLLLRGHTEASVVGSILAFSPRGQGIAAARDIELDIKCTLIFGNAAGDWTQAAAVLLDRNDNQQTDPGFVNAAKGNFALRSDSAGRDAVCGVVGALP